MNLFNSHKFIDFVFIWVCGLYSFLQYLNDFSSHHLAMFEYDFRTLQHSIAGSRVVAGLYNHLVAIFNALWLSWYTLTLSTNSLCALFRIRLTGSPILYPQLYCSNIHTDISLIQNPTGE